MTTREDFFQKDLDDEIIVQAIEAELGRQQHTLELIAVYRLGPCVSGAGRDDGRVVCRTVDGPAGRVCPDLGAGDPRAAGAG